MDIITFIFNVVITVVFTIVKFILSPIDALISSGLPSVADGLTAIGNFLNLMSQGLGWALSASGIPYSAIALIASYYIFKITVPINVWIFKLFVSWYRAIRG